MHLLYPPEEAEQLHRRSRRSGRWILCIGAAALILCVTLCFFVRTGNASRLLTWVIAVSTLSGWACILIGALVYFPARAEADHMRGILSETPEERRGTLSVSPLLFHIPRSVTVRRAILTDGEEKTTLHVLARKAKKLPAGDVYLRVYTVRNFITAFEECHEND